jgi:cobalt-zinc-cadmium efflux system membrane fusion protein
VKHLIRLLPLLTLLPLVGCRNDAAPSVSQAESGAKDRLAEAARAVLVDPGLLDTGRIKLFKVRASLATDSLAIPGEVVSDPEGEALVGALVAGRVRSLAVDVGDEVKKGAILAVVDAPEIARTRARLAEANAALTLAQSQLDRQEQLRAENATSGRALDQARAELTAAHAQVDSAKALLSSWGVAQGQSVSAQLAVRSPIHGVVAARNATLGGAVRPDETLFRIIAPERVVILAQWPESRLAIPKPKSILQVRPRARAHQSEPCEALVETQGRVVNTQTRTVTLRLRPKEPCDGLLPGAYVNVLARGEETGAGSPSPGSTEPSGTEAPTVVQVPRLSVVDVRGLPTVFVAEGPKGSFVPRTVLAEPSAGDFVVITSGLAPGERVASAGVILLKGEMLRDVLGGE